MEEDLDRYERTLKKVKKHYPNKTLMRLTEKNYNSIRFIDENTRDVGWNIITTCFLDTEYIDVSDDEAYKMKD